MNGRQKREIFKKQFFFNQLLLSLWNGDTHFIDA